MACRLRKRTQVGRFVLLLLALLVISGACQQPLVQNPDFTTDFDTEAPGASSLSGVSATSNQQPTWTWTSGGNGIGYYRYRINGGAWQQTTETSYTPEAPLPEGIYLFEVSERDDRGNWSESSRLRTAVDLTPPDPLAISVPGTPLLDANGDPVPNAVITGETQPVWSWVASGNGAEQFAIDSSGAGGSAPPIEGTGFPPDTYEGVSDTSYQPGAALGTGSHTVRVSERDEAGNWSAWVQFTVVIDLTIPTVTLLDDSGTPGDGITNINPPELRVTTGTGPTVTDAYRWRVDASDWTVLSGASPLTFTPPALTDGAHIFEVQQQREDGSYSFSATATVTIDTTAPNAPIVTTAEPNPTPNLRPTWDWGSGGGGGAAVFEYDTSDLGGGVSGEVGVLSYTPATDLPNNDTYTLRVRERDVAGNWSGWGSLNINVLNSPPRADAGPDAGGVTSSAIPLDGSGSFDPDGDPIIGYQWSVVAGPGAGVFSTPTNATTTFTTGTVGSFTIELEVTTAEGVATDTMVLSVTSLPPVANAGPDTSGATQFAIQLDGSGSSDPEGDPISYDWLIETYPAGAFATLLNPSSVAPTLTTDTIGNYTIRLTVGAAGGIDEDTVAVSVSHDPIVTDGLLAYYPLDGDATGYGTSAGTGTLSGGPTPATNRHLQAGRATEFDGVDDVIDFNGGPYSGNNVVTVSFWLNATTDTPLIRFIATNDSAILIRTTSASVGFAISLPSTNTAAGAITLNNWHHIVGTYDGNEIRLYVDTALVDTVAHPGTMSSDGFVNGPLEIGARGSSYWPGIVDDLRFYNRILTAGERTQLFNE